MIHDQIKCPIWPDCKVEIVEEIATKDLIWLYRHYHNIDVANEFEATSHIYLIYNAEKDFHFFYPLKNGSAEFYRHLYSRLGYSSKKPEYEWATPFIKPGDSVLDVGCGFGDFSQYVVHANYTGIEPNPESVVEAHKRGVNAKKLSILDVVRSKEMFDVVVAFQVLEHVDDPKAFFRACAKCLQKGGLLIVSVPNVNGYMSVRENTPLNLPPHHSTWWGLRTLIYLGAEEKMTVLDYCEGKNTSLANLGQVLFKSGFNDLLRREKKHIRPGRGDRFLNWLFFQFGRFLPRPSSAIAPNGHSFTVVYRKL